MDLESHGKSLVSIVTSYESHDSNDEPHRILDGGRPINIAKSLQMGYNYGNTSMTHKLQATELLSKCLRQSRHQP